VQREETECHWCSEARAVSELAFVVPVLGQGWSIVVRRHAPDWWALTADERQAVLDVLDRLRAEHVGPLQVQFGSGDGHAHVDVALSTDRLHNGPARPLLPALADLIDSGEIQAADLVVAFVMVSGLRLLQPQLDAVLDRGGRVRLLTTDYLGVTEKAALEILLARMREYGQRFEARVYRAGAVSFHPKAYLLAGEAAGAAFVGSANASASGLRDGVEWSLETRDHGALAQMRESFEELWTSPQADVLTQALIDDFVEAERTPGAEVVAVAPPAELPTPTSVQVEALEALAASRAEGFAGGLVVMATGLGKTWLAAFDATRPQFRRVLFVAHREEILLQTREVFRQVRPDASVGLVMGEQHDAGADVVLATVQSLSRRLDQIPADRFDYVVVDEFHHAAAPTYRRVVDHLQPAFLLGLTATPDRADKADLLSLCEDNLAFECGLAEGIDRRLLSPFRYYGVPDPVDFAPLPWRNSRFDPEALESAVITEERAQAALREWQRLAGTRTLAFCVSVRHADFMARVFREAGIAAVAVHSGPTSAPRHEALFDLARGALQVVFSVDMFNEGVDVPEVDTVLLLRPTQSPIVFLQQIGRGLRLSAGKEHLQVIDFVGNHRSFLLVARVLAGLREGSLASDARLREVLDSGEFALPEGCSVDYEVEVLQGLLSMLPATRGRSLAGFVEAWRAEQGYRPTAAQTFQAGYNPASAPGRWFAFLLERGYLEPAEAEVARRHGELLAAVAATSMTKSYKMVTLRAFCQPQALVTGMPVEELTVRSRRLVLRDPRLLADVRTKDLADPERASLEAWVRWWRKWPLEHLEGSGFRIVDDRFELHAPVSPGDAAVLSDLLNELIDWRLARYLQAKGLSRGEAALVKVIRNASGSPILMLGRDRNPDLPEGRGVPVQCDSEWLTFDFMKVAVNIARRSPEGDNELADLLRGWFGPDAGASGTEHRVRLWRGSDGWRAEPVTGVERAVEA
jgi:superfamily II DNA or RNA helicase/HKD family nuclease